MALNLKDENTKNLLVLMNDKSKSDQLISDLLTKTTSILSVVESLSSILTSDDKTIRNNGVEFLSWLLSKLPLNFLTDKELSYFSAFFCDRLVDHHSIIPAALRGILSLLKMKEMPEKCVAETTHKIFQYVTCQAQLVQDRRTLYEIFRLVSQSHFSVVQKTGPDFLYGVLTSIEGETDPQNLMFLFGFLPDLIKKLNIDHLTENLFEVLSIYFPVDFTTVKKEDVVITREDLAEGLSLCLSATRKLSTESLSLILEKLESTFKVAKIDSYKLLRRCCDNLTAADLEPFLEQFWKIIFKDLIPVLDATVQTEALKALTAVISVLGSGEIFLNKILDDILIAIRGFISNVEDGFFAPAMKILLAVNQGPTGKKRVSLELDNLCRGKQRKDSELLALISAISPFVSAGNEPPVGFLPICFAAFKSTTAKSAAFSAVGKFFGSLAADLKAAVCRECLSVVVSCRNISAEFRQLLLVIAQTDQEHFGVFYGELENLRKSGEIGVEIFLAVSETVVCVPSLTLRILPRFLEFGPKDFVLDSLLVASENAPDEFLINLTLPILSLISQNEDRQNHEKLAKLLKNVVANNGDQISLLSSPNFPPIFETTCVILTEGALAALRSEIHDDRFLKLVPILTAIARNGSDPVERDSAGRLLASFVNKFPEKQAEEIVEKAGKAAGDSENDVRLFCWVLKGAVLRGLPAVDAYLTHWFSLLNCGSVSSAVADGTGLLLRAESVFLNVSCHCTVKFLYKQRLFSYLPRLSALLTSATPDIRANYLLTMVQLASAVPHSVLMTEEPAVIAAVSQALLTHAELSLTLLREILLEKSSLFADHISSLLPVLLLLTQSPSLLTVRKLALQCLYLAANYPTVLTLPFKQQVIRELLTCLDDRKRVVRAEAVKTRSRWFLVGAVGEDALLLS